jgi:DNA repair exonuclease SbcCD ATPase subunit
VSNQPSDIDRGLFGYRRSSVDQALSERDIMLGQSENRAREAEARAQEMEERMSALHELVAEQQLRLTERERELEEQMAELSQRVHAVNTQLSARDEEMAERDQQILELRAHIDRLVQQREEVPRPGSAPPAPMMSEEVGRLLKAAEDSAAHIVEQARAVAARHAAESEGRWRELQISLATYAGWRERIEPQVADLRARVEDLGSRIGEIPDRVRAAFAPLANASAATEAGLHALAEEMTPPPLSAPSASEHRSDPVAESGFRDTDAGTGSDTDSGAASAARDGDGGASDVRSSAQ